MFRGRRVASHELYSLGSFCPLSGAERLTQFVAPFRRLLAIDWPAVRPRSTLSFRAAPTTPVRLGPRNLASVRLRPEQLRSPSRPLGMTNRSEEHTSELQSQSN